MGVTNHWTEVDWTGLDSQTNKKYVNKPTETKFRQDQQLTTTDLTNGIGLV